MTLDKKGKKIGPIIINLLIFISSNSNKPTTFPKLGLEAPAQSPDLYNMHATRHEADLSDGLHPTV
ncbi:hypothetical protein JCM13664_19400 [Methylothermus subterraneus]